MGALSLGTFQVINRAQLLVFPPPPVGGISLRVGGEWVSPSGWWEKSILVLGIRLEQHLEGGYGQTLPPSTRSSISPGCSAASVWTRACCCLDGDRRVPSSWGPQPPLTKLCTLPCHERCTAMFAWERRVKNPTNKKKIP